MKNMSPIITASVICMNQNHIARDVSECIKHGITNFHVDPMDGNFVPRLGMYPEQVRYIKEEFPNTTVDVHVMLDRPNDFLKAFCDAGSDIVMVHAENHRNLFGSIGIVKGCGKKAGVCLNIATDVSFLKPIAKDIDYVMLMGFNPGILNQKMWLGLYEKIRRTREAVNSDVNIMIDGGVKFDTALELWNSGADYLVAGTSTLFHPDDTIANNIARMNAIFEDHAGVEC